MKTNEDKPRGLIHIYCGEGKGKTTAAVGLIVRSAGSGHSVMLVQFLKNGHSGEIEILRNLPSVCVMTGSPPTSFTRLMSESDRQSACERHIGQLDEAFRASRNGEIDLLVLDEAIAAIREGLLPEKAVLDFLKDKPASLEVVLTGRYPSEALLETADYISDITCVRHPYQRGIIARKGIEY